MKRQIMEKFNTDSKNADRIAAGAHQLFYKHGIRSVTMDDIAHHLSVSKKTVYKYFANKRELVQTLIDKEILSNEVNYKILTGSGHDAVLELFLILTVIRNLYLKINPVITRELRINYPDAWQKLTEHKNHFIYPAIESCIRKGITEAVFQPDLEVGVRAGFFLKSLTLISDTGIRSCEKLNANNLSTEIFNHLIAGIANARGNELITRYKNKHKLVLIISHLNDFMKDSCIRRELYSGLSTYKN